MEYIVLPRGCIKAIFMMPEWACSLFKIGGKPEDGDYTLDVLTF